MSHSILYNILELTFFAAKSSHVPFPTFRYVESYKESGSECLLLIFPSLYHCYKFQANSINDQKSIQPILLNMLFPYVDVVIDCFSSTFFESIPSISYLYLLIKHIKLISHFPVSNFFSSLILFLIQTTEVHNIVELFGMLKIDFWGIHANLLLPVILFVIFLNCLELMLDCIPSVVICFACLWFNDVVETLLLFCLIDRFILERWFLKLILWLFLLNQCSCE